jgi:hypothetical protein
MKILLAVAAIAALSGCAVQQPYYASRPVVSDPYQWHTVSVQPSDRAPGSSGSYTTQYAPTTDSSRVVYSEPVYAAPVYAPAPVYYAPAPAYYYPPVSIGLDFVWGSWGHRGGWGGRGHYRPR